MSEEKDDAQLAEEQAMVEAGQNDGGVGEIYGVPPQIQPTPVPAGPEGRQASPGPGARDHAHPAGKRAGSHPRRLEGTSKYRGRDVA